MDLPSDRLDATFADYAEAVTAALPPGPDVVLVGHSLAGMVIPLVALRRPLQKLVFLCALMPERAGDKRLPSPPTHVEGTFDDLLHHDDGSHSWPDVDAAARILYQDCSREVATSAFAQLRRQQTALWDGLEAMAVWPTVPVAAIHCRDDRAINPLWSVWIARRRLGIHSVELPGGHSPMISRPALLAETLVARC